MNRAINCWKNSDFFHISNSAQSAGRTKRRVAEKIDSLPLQASASLQLCTQPLTYLRKSGELIYLWKNMEIYSGIPAIVIKPATVRHSH